MKKGCPILVALSHHVQAMESSGSPCLQVIQCKACKSPRGSLLRHLTISMLVAWIFHRSPLPISFSKQACLNCGSTGFFHRIQTRQTHEKNHYDSARISGLVKFPYAPTMCHTQRVRGSTWSCQAAEIYPDLRTTACENYFCPVVKVEWIRPVVEMRPCTGSKILWK